MSTETDTQTVDPFEATDHQHLNGGAPEAAGDNIGPGPAQAAEGDDVDPQEALFVVEHEKRVGLSSLYGRGTPVEYAFNLGSKAVPGGKDTGLVSFSDPHLTLIVPVRAGKVVIDPSYDGEGNVKKVTIRAHMKPLTAYDARSEAGRVALGEASA